MYLIGVLIFLVGAWLTLTLRGVSLTVLWVPPAILITVIAPILSVLTTTGGWRTFGRGLKAAIFPHKPVADDDMSRAALLRRLLLPQTEVPEEEMGRAATLFRLLSKVTALCTGISLLLSIIAAFQWLDDAMHFWAAVSRAPISPLLALVLIAGVYEPVVFIMKKRQSAARVRVKKD